MTQPPRVARHAAASPVETHGAPPGPPMGRGPMGPPPGPPMGAPPMGAPPMGASPMGAPPGAVLAPLDPFHPVQPGDFVAPKLFADHRRKGHGGVIALLLVLLLAGGGAVWWFHFRSTGATALSCADLNAKLSSHPVPLTFTVGAATHIPVGYPYPDSPPDVTCAVDVSDGEHGTVLSWGHLDRLPYEHTLLDTGWLPVKNDPRCNMYVDDAATRMILVCTVDGRQLAVYQAR